LPDALEPRQPIAVRATRPDGSVRSFEVVSRIDGPVEARYYRNGGILNTVLRELLGAEPSEAPGPHAS
jgi:aconitate hydratase